MSARFLKYHLLDSADPQHDYKTGDMLIIDRKRNPRRGEFVLACPWNNKAEIKLYRYGEAPFNGKPLLFPVDSPDDFPNGSFYDQGDLHVIGMVCGYERWTPSRPSPAPVYSGEARLVGRTRNPYRNRVNAASRG